MNSISNRLLALDLGDTLKLGNPQTIPGGVDAGATRSVGMVYRSVSDFINLLLPLAFVVAGLILLFLLIGGGFAIIAGGGDAKSVENGQKQITSAVLGFAVIFAAYWIIKVIEIVTGLEIFNPTYF